MTEQEAIEELKCYRAQSGTSYPEEIEVAIKALEEIQQYREIGTVEECREAVEKQTAKKPPVINRPNIFVKVPVCPNCSTQEHYQPIYGKAKYCSNCGQKLDLDN